MLALADQQRSTACEVLADGCQRAVGDRHEPLPGSVKTSAAPITRKQSWPESHDLLANTRARAISASTRKCLLEPPI
jgi:hypothetical protein